jgi:hypothetical protein
LMISGAAGFASALFVCAVEDCAGGGPVCAPAVIAANAQSALAAMIR